MLQKINSTICNKKVLNPRATGEINHTFPCAEAEREEEIKLSRERFYMKCFKNLA